MPSKGAWRDGALDFSNEHDAQIGRANRFAHLLGLTPQQGGYVKESQVVIIDMNAFEDEVVELVSAVAARMIFAVTGRSAQRRPCPPPARGGAPL